MEAQSLKIKELFQNNIVLRIPYFQRSYVWGKENWERFCDDMFSLLEDDSDNYFLGSVIIKKREDIHQLGYTQFDVVDGQQRLTTLVIFIKLLSLMASKDENFRSTFILDDTESEPVLAPNRKDSAAFKEIIKLEGITNNFAETGKVRDAYEFFRDYIAEKNIQPQANTLLRVMYNKVFLVRIIVGEHEDEQQIFDTINSLGQDLTTGELLKNHIFSDRNVNLYDELWAPIFEGNSQNDYSYWTKKRTSGRIKTSNIETFFYYFMLIKMQDPTIKANIQSLDKKRYRKQENLFDSYKSLIKKQQLDYNVLIEEIAEYATIFKNNINENLKDKPLVKHLGIERLVLLMFAQDSWTPVPYLLYIIKNVTDEEEKIRILNYLEVYLVRRIICKSKNNNYSDLFSENLIGQGVLSFDDFKNYVNDSNARGNLLMPSDEDVKEALQTKDLSRDALTILYFLESKINHGFTTNTRHNNSINCMLVEPLMPFKADTTDWALSDGVTEEERSVLVKTLGNYTIIREKLPIGSSNSIWNTKRQLIEQKSENLNLGQIANSVVWNDDSIKNRNTVLANMIISNWPL